MHRVTAHDFRFANVRRAILMCQLCSCVEPFSAFECYRAASVSWFNGSHGLHPTFETIEIVVVSKSELCSVCVARVARVPHLSAWHLAQSPASGKPPPGYSHTPSV